MPNQHRSVSDWATRHEAVTQHARWLNLGSGERLDGRVPQAVTDRPAFEEAGARRSVQHGRSAASIKRYALADLRLGKFHSSIAIGRGQ